MAEISGAGTSSQMYGCKLSTIRAILLSKKWFAFDLDDTLHNFRTASRAAIEAVFIKIHAGHAADIDVMRQQYRAILAEKTSSAFTDGRTSREYRMERFEALLQVVQVTHNTDYLEHLADLHQQELSHSLCLEPGAMQLLQLLKSLGKKIVIITEGPEDAQTWTIQQLGIHDLVDSMATTNRFRVSTVDGLLEKVMLTLEISAPDLVCIGDSMERDIEPAIQASVYAIHYAKGDEVVLDQSPIRVNSHQLICSLVENGTAKES